MPEYLINLGLDGLAPGLSGLAERLSDLSPALMRAGELVYASVMDNFASQGRPKRWDPLKPETVRRKGHGMILIDTGRLIGSITWKISRDSVTVTATVPYADQQQDGSLFSGLPARPFLIIQGEDISKVVSLFESYITRV